MRPVPVVMGQSQVGDEQPALKSLRHWMWGLLPVLGGLVFVSLAIGRYPITVGEIGQVLSSALFGTQDLDATRYRELQNVLLEVRVPRILAAVLIGASLSVSGAAFQALFINPLVSPGLLGVLSGASFGAAAAMVVSDHWLLIQASSFACGLLAVLVAIGIASLYRSHSLLMLVLGGIISGALFTSLLSIVKYLADPYNQLPAIVFWLMGRLTNVDARTVYGLAIPMLGGTLVIAWLAKYLNVLSMGEEEARALGVNVRVVRAAVIGCATLISALTVVMAGMIGWVGLVIPHITRLLVGPNNEVLVPVSAIIGAIFLLGVDDLARNLFSAEIPLGIVTELIGILAFLLVLNQARRGWTE